MTATDLYVVAAGHGSRLNSSLPKALVPITDEPCLTTTLQQIGGKFRKVFVVTNVLVLEAWKEYFQSLSAQHHDLVDHVVNLPIESGLGDGHATLQGFIAAERTEGTTTLAEDIVVAWGDVFFQHAEIIDELLTGCMVGSGLLPVVREKHPYVSLLVNEQMQCIAADFSKYGESHAEGLHDQSVFRFRRRDLKESLLEIHKVLWKGGRYITPGGELSLLYSFHHLFNSGTPAYIYETQYPTLTFNNVMEVAKIQREINQRYKDMHWRGRDGHNAYRAE